MNPHSDPVAHVLSELAKRHASEIEARRDEALEAATHLRKPFHPKQRAFYCSRHKRKATKKTRRAGATWGGARELMARSLEVAGHRATYVTKTRIEARARAWENDTRSGFLDVLKQEARFVGADGVDTYELGGMRVEVRKADMELNFANGSQINLFGLKDDASLGKQRGLAKHVYWIDEAQDVPALDRFYKATITPALADFRGEVWLTGTPGIDCAGMFYNVTAEEEDDRLPGWEIHTVAVVDNPYFGHVEADGDTWVVVDNLKERHGPYATEAEAEKAATEIRWENTAGVAKRENGWRDDDPDFIREWLGQWVKTDARYVYPVHGVPKHVLVYAPQRLAENPIDRSHAKWLDVDAALLDLPRGPGRDYEWMFGIGADFGYAQTPFAVTVWACTFDRPDIFEVFAWKQHKVLPDDQRQYLELLFRALPNVIVFVGDPAGQKEADLDAWRTRFNIPIEAADKAAKNTWQELMAGDIRKGNVHYREGSPMLHEATHLVYLPTKPGKTRKDDEFRRIADGSVPGNDCCFVAGTLVAVPGGVAPIETLHPGDLVVTRHGIRRVLDAAPTRVAPTFALTLKNGMTIRGTGDHPILTTDGWIPLQSLTRDSMVIACQSLELASEDRQSLWSSTASAIDAIRNHPSEVIGCTTSELGRGAGSRITSHSIEPFGNPHMGRRQRAFTSTIATAIRSTTRSIIWSWSKAASICASTWNRLTASVQRGLASLWPSRPLLSGIGQQRDALGMWSTGARPWLNDRSTTESASFVTRTSAAKTRPQKYAACDATPSDAAIQASTTLTASAPSVAPSIGATSITGPAVAPMRVQRVEPSGLVEQTYNLTVDGEHEYIANGVVVHNCDAGLYAYRYLQHHLYRDKPKDTRSPAEKQAAEYEEQVRKMGEIQRRVRDDLEYGSYGDEYDY